MGHSDDVESHGWDVIFTAEYRTTDGRVFGAQVVADTWDDALSRAAEMGVVIDGTLCAVVDEDSDVVTHYPEADTFPRCPAHLMNHPNLRHVGGM